MARGITIRELSTVLEGDIDLQGLLGLDDTETIWPIRASSASVMVRSTADMVTMT
jgi:hypothetical protein